MYFIDSKILFILPQFYIKEIPCGFIEVGRVAVRQSKTHQPVPSPSFRESPKTDSTTDRGLKNKIEKLSRPRISANLNLDER